MIFLLSSPRSGSTLLRVMLSGHPSLFCPPELNLLQFESMAERDRSLGPCSASACRKTGCDQREGLQRALGELGIEIDNATLLEQSTSAVYKMLQEAAAPRVLVDKSPLNSAKLATLKRAESSFERPYYIHLYRHPYATIESLVRNRFDLMLGLNLTDTHAFAEYAWTETNQNTLTFLLSIEQDRVYSLRYEDLVREPEKQMTQLCSFLNLPFDARLLRPYEAGRMTDGIRPGTPALGDPNFLQHAGIEARLGETWRDIRLPRPLDEAAQKVAEQLGYELL